jgi:hypothetical protein
VTEDEELCAEDKRILAEYVFRQIDDLVVRRMANGLISIEFSTPAGVPTYTPHLSLGDLPGFGYLNWSQG